MSYYVRRGKGNSSVQSSGVFVLAYPQYEPCT